MTLSEEPLSGRRENQTVHHCVYLEDLLQSWANTSCISSHGYYRNLETTEAVSARCLAL
jgi:hypothetical protein